MKKAIPNLLNRTEEHNGEQNIYHFGNGLIIKTESIWKKDTFRILPLGNPQGFLMNHMLNFPEIVVGKSVFEPFAGSGPLGFMALKIGAKFVEFLDINPRAIEFQAENANLNGFNKKNFKCTEGDISTFIPENKYDVIFANPPFIPTPDLLDGTITSNGGADGNKFIEILLRRLETFLKPEGEAFILAFQIVENDKPLIVNLVSQHLERRFAEITLAQEPFIDLKLYVDAYKDFFPQSEEAINIWASDLNKNYGPQLTLSHYVIHIGQKSEKQTAYIIADNFKEKYGVDLKLRYDPKELARGRVLENVIF
jgi:methylase of polypeptide subunit release factors